MKNRAACGAVSKFFRSQPSFAKATAGFSLPLILAVAYSAEAATSAAKAGSREVFWRRRIKNAPDFTDAPSPPNLLHEP